MDETLGFEVNGGRGPPLVMYGSEEKQSALVRYDGEAVPHSVPKRWKDYDRHGVHAFVDEIGDTMSLRDFLSGISTEISQAHARQDQHGVYVTINEDISEQELYDGIRASIDSRNPADPRLPYTRLEAGMALTALGTGTAALYYSVEVKDPLTGYDLVKPLTGAAGFSLAESIRQIRSTHDQTAADAILPQTDITEIETIPEGEHTYCITYKSPLERTYFQPLEQGREPAPDPLLFRAASAFRRS